MNVLKCLAGLALVAVSLPSNAARDLDDPWTAHYMWRRYHNTTAPCDAAQDKADYLCTGVLIRGTHPGEAKHVWWPEPKSLDGTSRATGGVSFSYLREDLKMLDTAWSYPNGFTVFPQMGKYKAPDDKIKLTVLCAFPVDGWTDLRDNKGCGTTVKFPQTSQVCPADMTGQKWVDTYPTLKGDAVCGFDMTTQSRAAFKPIVDAMHILQGKKSGTNADDELRIAAWPADDETSKVFPIESFFYKAGSEQGLKNAQADQLDFYNSTKQFVPVIKIVFPSTTASSYDFSYTKADQNPNVPIPKFPAKDPLPCDKNGGFDTKC